MTITSSFVVYYLLGINYLSSKVNTICINTFLLYEGSEVNKSHFPLINKLNIKKKIIPMWVYFKMNLNLNHLKLLHLCSQEQIEPGNENSLHNYSQKGLFLRWLIFSFGLPLHQSSSHTLSSHTHHISSPQILSASEVPKSWQHSAHWNWLSKSPWLRFGLIPWCSAAEPILEDSWVLGM